MSPELPHIPVRDARQPLGKIKQERVMSRTVDPRAEAYELVSRNLLGVCLLWRHDLGGEHRREGLCDGLRVLVVIGLDDE